MPEQVKRPNPWRRKKEMMIITQHDLYEYDHFHIQMDFVILYVSTEGINDMI
jgi:hypothetical protein